MKKILLSLLFIGCISCTQNRNHIQRRKNDSTRKMSYPADFNILVKKLSLPSFKDIQISKIKLGENSKELCKIARIDSIVKETSDFDTPALKKYYIKKSYFEVGTDENLYGFDIVDSTLILKSFDIKVGDEMQMVINKLRSYIDSKHDMNNIKENILRIKFGNSDDQYLMFTFKNGRLNEYETWTDD